MKQLLECLKLADPTTYDRAFGWFKNVVWDLIKDDPEKYFLESGPYPLRDALLQAVLQKAISDRGWYWGFAVGTLAAIVSKDMQNLIKRSGDSPSQSLLAAYLAAIG